MRVSAILLAAGRGERFKSRISKPLVKLSGNPIINYSLNVLNQHPLIKDIIIVVNSANKKAILSGIKKFGYKKVRSLVLGGVRRQDSVYNALKKIEPTSGWVLIHDSARPFLRARDISFLISQAECSGAAILGVPVKAAVKEVTSRQSPAASRLVVKRTLNREKLFEIQTPQVFARDLLIKAYQRFGRIDVPDDAALIEKSGGQVVLVPGFYENIKITTPEDLIIAEAIISSKF